jgi:hypothetical protein
MVVGVDDKTLSGKVDEQTNQAEMPEAGNTISCDFELHTIQ